MSRRSRKEIPPRTRTSWTQPARTTSLFRLSPSWDVRWVLFRRDERPCSAFDNGSLGVGARTFLLEPWFPSYREIRHCTMPVQAPAPAPHNSFPQARRKSNRIPSYMGTRNLGMPTLPQREIRDSFSYAGFAGKVAAESSVLGFDDVRHPHSVNLSKH